MKGNGTNGVWILTRVDNPMDKETYTCSQCKRHYVEISIAYKLFFPSIPTLMEYPFCHCGAKMKLESARVTARKRREANKTELGILDFPCEELDK